MIRASSFVCFGVLGGQLHLQDELIVRSEAEHRLVLGTIVTVAAFVPLGVDLCEDVAVAAGDLVHFSARKYPLPLSFAPGNVREVVDRERK